MDHLGLGEFLKSTILGGPLSGIFVGQPTKILDTFGETQEKINV